VRRVLGGASGLVLALLVALPVAAHTRSSSTSRFEIDPGGPDRFASARIQVRAPLSELEAALQDPAARAAGTAARLDAAEIDAYLAARFQLLVDGRACAPRGPASALASADPGHVARRWSVACPATGALTLRADGFFESAPAHLHLARVRVGDEPPREHVVVLANRRLPIPVGDAAAGAPEAPGSGFLDFVRLGVEHIFGGVDHLVFLAGLLLVARSLREIGWVVTGFTVAHSVTLALGVLGMLRPDPTAIEALIGLSIVVVALENFALTTAAATQRAIAVGLAALLGLAFAGALAGRVTVPALTLVGVALFGVCHLALAARSRRPELLRWAVAFAFGLIHGFGFAGALAELALPAGRTAQALLGFNLGVELGQLAVVAAAWPLLRLAVRGAGGGGRLLVQAGSTPVLAAGLYWFLTRSLG